MKLLLDAGNTRVKLSWVATGADARVDEVAAFGYDDGVALGSWLAALPEKVSQVWGASVVDQSRMTGLEMALSAALGQPLQGEPVVRWLQGQPQAAGVRNAYAVAQTLGPDRWAALLGLAWHERRQGSPRAAALLASFGTATTLDALVPLRDDVSCDYVFPGGLILPGVDLMSHALAQGTARLPRAPGHVRDFPVQTSDAIATGVAAAQAGAVWRQWRQLQAQADSPPKRLYVTGGAWPELEPELGQWFETGQMIYLAAPVLDGLACLATQNLDTDH